MSDDLREPLTSSEKSGGGGGGDDSSQRSSQSSLLERIRAQRAQQQEQQTSVPTSTIQIPQYNPVAPEENFAGGGPAQLSQQQAAATATTSNSGSNFFSSAWNNINESMENGMASLQQEDTFESNQALLAPSAAYTEENYSMMEYFMTFVRDVYGTFLSLPLLVRIAVIFALLFTAFKLM